jgi:hypothetical protein
MSKAGTMNLRMWPLTLLLCMFASPALGVFPHPEAPRTLNYYLRTDLATNESTLAQWDLLILPHQVIDESAASLQLIRDLNPDQITLAYIDPFQIPANPLQQPGNIQYDFVNGVEDEWLARNTAGEIIEIWENSIHVNFTSACPEVGGRTYREYFVEFVTERLLTLIDSDIIDGVFLDEMSNGGYLWWDDQPSFVGEYDYDGDALPDDPADLANWMTEGVHYFSDNLGAALPEKGYLMGNNCKPYQPGVTGKLYEAFPGAWEGYVAGTLMDLDVWNSLEPGANINSINAVYLLTHDLRAMRYRLAASLLSDNYFSFDASTLDHYQLTWYDLFDTPLGRPAGERYTIGELPLFSADFEDSINVEVEPFTPHSTVAITTEPGLVIQGDSSLLMETYVDENWPTHFYLEPTSGWVPGETYIISFRYRILDAQFDEASVFFKSSPGNMTSSALRAVSSAEGLYRGAITLGDDPEESVRLITHGPTSMVIDSLTVVQGSGGLWARNYENGAVICNTSGEDVILPFNPDWQLEDAGWQQTDHPEWAGGSSVVVPYEDGLIFTLTNHPTQAPESSPQPDLVVLGAPWPNPFNPSFSVKLGGTEGAHTVLSLHDVRGRLLSTLWSGELGSAGERLDFDLDRDLRESLPSGVYLLRAGTAEFQVHRKLILLR